MKTWNKRTKAVHAGTRRSQYNEVSEAIYLTQGFVYDTAEDAEARFLKAGDDSHPLIAPVIKQVDQDIGHQVVGPKHLL